VLALQGDWAAHEAVLSRLGVMTAQVRTHADLATVDALVVPGGESTTMLRLLEIEGLFAPLQAAIRSGLPAFGTCAGAILLAGEVEPEQPTVGCLDVTLRRNAYGRQVHSRVVPVRLGPELGTPGVLDGVFIRAPRILRAGDGVTVLGWREDDPVVVQAANLMAATFHPELTADDRIHRYFIDQVARR
jgi:5'-phosphate synthase pdxT subunit